MIAVHVQEMFALPQVAESWPGTVVKFFGGLPAAPVFMFLLGAGIVYSRKATAGILAKRGLLIMLAGYLLNLLRSTLPLLLQGALNNDSNYYAEALTGLIEIDILQFAGLALILFAIIRALGLGWKTVIAAGITCAVANVVIARAPVTGRPAAA